MSDAMEMLIGMLIIAGGVCVMIWAETWDDIIDWFKRKRTRKREPKPTHLRRPPLE